MKNLWQKIKEFFKTQKWAKWVALGATVVSVLVAGLIAVLSSSGNKDASSKDNYSSKNSHFAEDDSSIVDRESEEDNSSDGVHVHSYVDKITREATCLELGVKTYACKCGDKYKEVIPALGHNYENYICTHCGDEIKPSEGMLFGLAPDSTYYILISIGQCTDTEIIIPAEYEGLPVKAIANRAFYKYEKLTSVIIPNGVTSIGDNAFYACKKLKNILIPNSVTSIGEYAFWNCEKMMRVEIGDGVTSIGMYAFAYCEGLTNIVIPNSVTSIGEYAFKECDYLKTIYYTGSITDWCNIDFKDNPLWNGGGLYINNVLVRELVIPDGIISIGVAFQGYKELTSVVIPDSMTAIGDAAFAYCKNLKNIVIPDSVTNIGHYAFYDCDSLTNVVISDSVTSIGYKAFLYCKNITSVEIGNGVTSIGEEAFYCCPNLRSVKIGNNVTSIGSKAFYECEKLTVIIFNGTIEQWNAIGKGYNWDYYVPATEVICSDGTVAI